MQAAGSLSFIKSSSPCYLFYQIGAFKMWRSNYNEDWERRKTYLIRSLFQDIPVLSPVSEHPESRSGSPSNIPASRPHSPLPPLVIERMPNRHDHPKEFYKDLKIKMIKMYKKLFLNKKSSSVDDLIETYGDDFAVSSLIDEFEDNAEEVDGGNASVSTLKLGENRSQYHSFSVPESSGQKTCYKNVSKCLSDGLTLSSKAGSSISSQGSRGRDVQSSTQSLCQNQVSTVVEIHKEPPSDHDETLRSPHHGIYTSLVLKCHRIDYNISVAQMEVYREEGNKEQPYKSNNETAGTETLGSVNEEDSSKEVDLDKISSREISNKSIEIMRRQKEVSLSLGSLQNEPFATSSSKRSSRCTNFELQNKVSLDLSEGSNSSENQRNLIDISFSSATFDFSNILTTSTPKLQDQTKIRSSSESKKTEKRERTESPDGDDEDNSIMINKRRKCENIAIQTSLISESDAENNNDWIQLKNKFFVGIPRIYKLCPCNDHACRID